MTGIKSLQTLVRLKFKRVESAQDALRDSRLVLQQITQAFEAQCELQTHAQRYERTERDRLLAKLDQRGGLMGHDIVILQQLLRDAEMQSARATQETEAALARVHTADREVKDADALAKRAEQQLEGVRLRLQQAQDAFQKAQEDAQDEEAEETAVARMVVARRAAASAASAAREKR